jgi:hypothetical protein
MRCTRPSHSVIQCTTLGFHRSFAEKEIKSNFINAGNDHVQCTYDLHSVEVMVLAADSDSSPTPKFEISIASSASRMRLSALAKLLLLRRPEEDEGRRSTRRSKESWRRWPACNDEMLAPCWRHFVGMLMCDLFLERLSAILCWWLLGAGTPSTTAPGVLVIWSPLSKCYPDPPLLEFCDQMCTVMSMTVLDSTNRLID